MSKEIVDKFLKAKQQQRRKKLATIIGVIALLIYVVFIYVLDYQNKFIESIVIGLIFGALISNLDIRLKGDTVTKEDLLALIEKNINSDPELIKQLNEKRL